MVDVDSVLQGVQERDKWRRRLELLERSLGEVQVRRRRLESRLRRLRKELARLRLAADSMVDVAARLGRLEVTGAPHGPLLR